MNTLKDKLAAFNPKSEGELGKIFLDLAESFLYGGYISVQDCKNEKRYKIYLRTVEFYCHSEKENAPEYLKDPIVYHRNGRYVEGEVLYFPLMAFHAHASGYDITFENEKLELRASALIRAYEVYDVMRKEFLTYSTSDKKFVACKTGKERVNHQSTYLYDFLNGFIGDSVRWVDDVRKTDDFQIKRDKRQNVYKYNGEVKTTDKDERKWSFARQEDLPF